MGEISKNVHERRLKWNGRVLRRRIRRQESDGDGGAWEKKERKTEADGMRKKKKKNLGRLYNRTLK